MPLKLIGYELYIYRIMFSSVLLFNNCRISPSILVIVIHSSPTCFKRMDNLMNLNSSPISAKNVNV